MQPCGHLLGKDCPFDSLACDVFCVLVIFLYGVLGKVWYLIVAILDLRFLLFFGWVCLCFFACTKSGVIVIF